MGDHFARLALDPFARALSMRSHAHIQSFCALRRPAGGRTPIPASSKRHHAARDEIYRSRRGRNEIANLRRKALAFKLDAHCTEKRGVCPQHHQVAPFCSP